MSRDAEDLALRRSHEQRLQLVEAQVRFLDRTLCVTLLLIALIVVVVGCLSGCSRPAAVCHGVVNGRAIDADATNTAWCEQLEDAAHMFNVQLFTGTAQDAIRVTLQDNLATQPIIGDAGGVASAAVWLDLGAEHCHDFRGVLTIESPPPNWKLSMVASAADGSSAKLNASLWGDLP